MSKGKFSKLNLEQHWLQTGVKINIYWMLNRCPTLNVGQTSGKLEGPESELWRDHGVPFHKAKGKKNLFNFSLWKKKLRLRICLSSGTSQKVGQKDVTVWVEGWRDTFTEAGKASNGRHEDSRNDYPVKSFVCIKVFTLWIKKKRKKKKK